MRSTLLARLAAALLASALCAHCGRQTPADGGLDVPATDATDAGPADACVVSDATPSYPPGPYDVTFESVLPDLRFRALDGHEVALHDYYTPCATSPKLLVIRTFPAWSGPSQWSAAHTGALRALPDGSRFTVVDLLALGPTNLPATSTDLAAWQARYDSPPDALALDPDYSFLHAPDGKIRPPLVVLVDPRSMRVLLVDSGLTSDMFAWDLTRFLATLDGLPQPRYPTPTLYDGRFSADQWDQIRAMTPVPPPPPDPTNAHADDPAAAALGGALFADARLSPSGTQSCASCHQQSLAFTDGRPTGLGVAPLDRNTPSVLFSAHQRWQFWDGRADTLWAQALGPCENAREMNSSRLFIAHAIAQNYGAQYQAVFGALPPLEDTARFPAAGKPLDPAWEAMAPADQDAATRVFVNVGKALEAYERTLRARPAPLDAYAAGDVNALTPSQRDGLMHFFDYGCVQCHHGPLLTDDSFHNIQMPTGRVDGQPDRGRIDAIMQLLGSPFRADGAFSDAPSTNAHLMGLAPSDAMLGQFHTPSLRATAGTGPWGHGGTFATLQDVVKHYAQMGMVAVPGTIGTQDPHLPNFHPDDNLAAALGDFLRALTDQPAP